MKFVIVLTVFASLAAPVSAATADWSKTIVATPMGFRIGNPNAKVKLVEYGSYTCSHCRDFHRSASAALRTKYLTPGLISFEFRSFVRNGPDYAASLLAGCDGPAKAAATTAALFDTQEQWTKPFAEMDDATAAKVGALPQGQQIGALAKAGGLTTVMAARGLPAAKADRCLADKAAADRLTATLKHAVEVDKVDGTPGFLIDGVRQAGEGRGVTTWADLEPRLVKALR